MYGAVERRGAGEGRGTGATATSTRPPGRVDSGKHQRLGSGPSALGRKGEIPSGECAADAASAQGTPPQDGPDRHGPHPARVSQRLAASGASTRLVVAASASAGVLAATTRRV